MGLDINKDGWIEGFESLVVETSISDSQVLSPHPGLLPLQHPHNILSYNNPSRIGDLSFHRETRLQIDLLHPSCPPPWSQ